MRSSAEKKEDVSSFFDQLEETAELICIYFPYPVYEISIFDESFIDNMADSLDKGLYAGTWWIQNGPEIQPLNEQRNQAKLLGVRAEQRGPGEQNFLGRAPSWHWPPRRRAPPL